MTGIDNTYEVSCDIEKCDKKAKIQFTIHSKHLKELDGIPDDAISSISDLSTLDVKVFLFLTLLNMTSMKRNRI